MADKKTSTGLAKVASEEQLAALRGEFPSEPGFVRIQLPRLGLVSQDQTEGKGKNMKVIAEAGTFYVERQSDEVDEETKQKTWERTDIGTEVSGIILYQRKQLRMYDEDTELYTSSPVFDSDSEVLPLFCEKKEVDRGTPKDLKEKYKYTDKNGKVRSKLEDNRILYVLVDGEMLQLNLRGTSMFAYMSYARTTTPNTVVTTFSSEQKEKGSIEWNQMSFTAERGINGAEAEEVMKHTAEIKRGIVSEKGYFAAQQSSGKREDETEEEHQERLEKEKNF